MPTLTIRNVPQHLIKSLKELASRNGRTLEQEAREILENHFGEQPSVLDQIEASWSEQSRRPTADEMETWIGVTPRRSP